ncbi:hypothetical protein F441_12460 [Phytophthora nicotianae CJ01A1]|uniref:Uncharacterized protein n=3 Tax=Phytophthora nicotianae TaxID=4792 RepID=V9EU66_PHYNI|nr:hypothetical protein F443_12496 [Phytophthora nicotianae P1569]ETK82403.1 hypothetical protein L915_12206 [Phytophthora nicotianae]ETL35788.1 hypothetical protein L916_12132 [Phytophthora nicotianae]ETP12103.1 hypothetical protein F441_12460 [Phytophthora nicotianae CJ01A1]
MNDEKLSTEIKVNIAEAFCEIETPLAKCTRRVRVQSIIRTMSVTLLSGEESHTRVY